MELIDTIHGDKGVKMIMEKQELKEYFEDIYCDSKSAVE